MNDSALIHARAGDHQAFAALTDPYRRELQLHCYRILGQVQDAEDAVQETLLSAWKALESFEERSTHHSGNKMAIDNIRERLQLHFDAEASLETRIREKVYQVHIVLPYVKATA